MTDSYVFRFIFCEICTMAAVLYFVIMVFPCGRSKKVTVLIGYGMALVYTAIMLVLGLDISGNGIPFRSVLLLTQQIILPCYLIGNRKWYRYIGISIMADLVSACLGSVLFTPFYYLSVGESSLYTARVNEYLYHVSGNFYLMIIYVTANFLGYFFMTKMIRWTFKKEKRKKHVLNITQGCFAMTYFIIGVIMIPSGVAAIRSANVISFITEGVGMLLIIQGMNWEKTMEIKNQELIRIRERIQYEQYLRIQKRQQRARKVRHDLADHMLTVQLLLEKGELEKARSYIESCNVTEE